MPSYSKIHWKTQIGDRACAKNSCAIWRMNIFAYKSKAPRHIRILSNTLICPTLIT
jgi:hypothetical protein